MKVSLVQSLSSSPRAHIHHQSQISRCSFHFLFLYYLFEHFSLALQSFRYHYRILFIGLNVIFSLLSNTSNFICLLHSVRLRYFHSTGKHRKDPSYYSPIQLCEWNPKSWMELTKLEMLTNNHCWLLPLPSDKIKYRETMSCR